MGGERRARHRFKELLHSLEQELRSEYGLSVIESRALVQRIVYPGKSGTQCVRTARFPYTCRARFVGRKCATPAPSQNRASFFSASGFVCTAHSGARPGGGVTSAKYPAGQRCGCGFVTSTYPSAASSSPRIFRRRFTLSAVKRTSTSRPRVPSSGSWLMPPPGIDSQKTCDAASSAQCPQRSFRKSSTE